MFESPYQTTACKNYRMRDTIAAVTQVKVRGELKSFDYFDGVTGQSDDCPLFTQPLTKVELGKHNDRLIFDVRAQTKLEGRGDDTNVVVTQGVAINEFNDRARLLDQWLQGYYADFSNVGELPIKTFMQYVGRAISSRLGLDARGELEVRAIVGYYYLMLFVPESEYNEDVRAKVIHRVGNVARMPADDLRQLFDGVTYIHDLAGMVEVIKSRLDTPRVQQLTVAVVFTLTGGGWFGQHARETLCVALEHPPTWIWMVQRAVQNQSYRRTLLTKVVQQNDQRGSGKDFIKSLSYLLRG